MKSDPDIATLTCAFLLALSGDATATEFVGAIIDANTGRPVAARLYVKGTNGRWLFVESAAGNGSALRYHEQSVPMPRHAGRAKPFLRRTWLPRPVAPQQSSAPFRQATKPIPFSGDRPPSFAASTCGWGTS